MSDVTKNEAEDISYTCWCGASGTYEDLCDASGLEDSCGGGGWLNCFCGGDQCVCHHHGGIDCDGCEDCGDDDIDYDEDGDG